MAAVPKTEQVLSTLTPRQLERLDAYAAHEEVSRSEAIRRFIVQGVARWEAAQKEA